MYEHRVPSITHYLLRIITEYREIRLLVSATTAAFYIVMYTE